MSTHVQPRPLVASIYADVPGFPRDALIRGNVGPWLAAERIPAQRMPRLRGWLVRLSSVSDLVARAELAGVVVFHRRTYALPAPPQARTVEPCHHAVAPAPTASGQLDLLDIAGVVA